MDTLNMNNMTHQFKQKLYSVLPECISMLGKYIPAFDIIQILYYKMFCTWAGHVYFINKNSICDKMIPDSDRWIKGGDRYNSEEFDKFLMSENFIRFTMDYEYMYINFENDFIIKQLNNGVLLFCNENITEDDEFIKKIQNNFVSYTLKDKNVHVGVLTYSSLAYSIEDLSFEKTEIDIKQTYNDDLPIDAFNYFVENEEQGICLMYGEPGTGKTTFIKYLMQEHPNKKFVILDSNQLMEISTKSLLSLFVENKDTIYILEDCELLLKSREDITNPIISTFLNMSNGIFGSVLKCKFICTFNTNLDNIDEAITRKGRLKLKYEFKKLDKNKCKKIDSSINDDMTIADLMYTKKENDFSKVAKKKIGFGV